MVSIREPQSRLGKISKTGKAGSAYTANTLQQQLIIAPRIPLRSLPAPQLKYAMNTRD